jgi:hypothetical protein
MLRNGIVAIAWLLLAPPLALHAGPPVRPPVMSPPVPPAQLPDYCSAPEHRQFDFLLGEWDVLETEPHGENYAMAGISSVKRISSGCALHQEWHPFSMEQNDFISHYDAGGKAWRQVWLDARGNRIDLQGAFEHRQMVLAGRMPGTEAGSLVRLTWKQQGNGTVRELDERSADGGKTWKLAYDFTWWPRRPLGS